MPQFVRMTPLDYTPQALEDVNIGPYGVGQGHKEVTRDGEMAYQHAIMFYVTGRVDHARKAMDILDGWATTNKTFQGGNAPLELGWALPPMLRAAELIKWAASNPALHNGPAATKMWRESGLEVRLNAWIDRIAFPLISKKITWTNNWNLSMAEARMQLAIFRENQTEFEWAINEFKRIQDVYVKPWKTGHCGETKRDIMHSQFGIGSMINLCEMAWHHGVDLYSTLLHRCMEYHASIILGNVPSDIKPEEIKENRFQPVGWEIGFQHFTRVKKLPMPYTAKLLEGYRPEKATFCWGLSTITHMRA